MKEKIENKLNKIQDWVKTHKKTVIVSGVTIALACIGIAASRNKLNEVELPIKNNEDLGKDCTMKFVVDETQEVLGEVPCTENYAKEYIDDYNNIIKK